MVTPCRVAPDGAWGIESHTVDPAAQEPEHRRRAWVVVIVRVWKYVSALYEIVMFDTCACPMFVINTGNFSN